VKTWFQNLLFKLKLYRYIEAEYEALLTTFESELERTRDSKAREAQTFASVSHREREALEIEVDAARGAAERVLAAAAEAWALERGALRAELADLRTAAARELEVGLLINLCLKTGF
jgi:hypothetical protein